MGKKQHQKDKLYLTSTEWKEFGGHKDDKGTRKRRADFKKLPLNHCALSLLPFETPACSPEGHIFDINAVTAYIKKHGVDPCSGKKLTLNELIPLKFQKDNEGNFRCPIMFNTLSENSHIVVIRPTGNVYSYEAVYELNIKNNHFKDLLTDMPFLRTDIITLQDPNKVEKFNIEEFHHVKLNAKTKEEIAREKKEMQKPAFFIRRMNNETKEALDQLKKDYVPKKIEALKEVVADEINAAHYSQGHVAAGFTSTTMAPITKQKAAVLADDVVRYARVKKNGYVRLVTNHGHINLELYCTKAPKACENFLTHCSKGYYNGTIFHRIIKNFMMQGGDPTGEGTGGESIWKKPFADEFVSGLSHDARGVLSMANKGTNTNQSQFFITFRPCKYLDKKHTIFGRVVGGQETLTSIERVPTEDSKDRPLEPVQFMRAEVFVDPFQEAEEEVQKERADILNKDKNGEQQKEKDKVVKPKTFSSGIGKYINPQNKRVSSAVSASGGESEIKKQKFAKSSLNDFSKW
ncbi:unnamed protein product [Auanema sp. JU1783]|nr:unnamed protein product [Auanema sp. JU1783]